MISGIKINLQAISGINDEQFYQFCRDNAELKCERDATGEILVMSPTGGETGLRNFELIGQFWLWNNRYKLGYCFDSSTCFKFPNGANRSPDLSFITKQRWEQLSLQEREIFPPIVPDFVLELMSPSDSLKAAQQKMQEYLDNGVQLGWLINRKEGQVEIYAPDKEIMVLEKPDAIANQTILPELTLNLQAIW